MQVNDVDCYGSSHIVVTGIIEEKTDINILLPLVGTSGTKPNSFSHLLIRMIIYYNAKLSKFLYN